MSYKTYFDSQFSSNAGPSEAGGVRECNTPPIFIGDEIQKNYCVIQTNI